MQEINCMQLAGALQARSLTVAGESVNKNIHSTETHPRTSLGIVQQVAGEKNIAAAI